MDSMSSSALDSDFRGGQSHEGEQDRGKKVGATQGDRAIN